MTRQGPRAATGSSSFRSPPSTTRSRTSTVASRHRSSAGPVIGLRRSPIDREGRTPGTYGRTRSDRNTRAGTASAHHHRRRGGGRLPRPVHRALGVLRRCPVVPRGPPLRRVLDGPADQGPARARVRAHVLRAAVFEPVDRPPHHAAVPRRDARAGDHRALPDAVRAVHPLAPAAVRARDRVLRRAGGHEPVADVPAVAQRLRVVVRGPRAAVPS